MAYALGPSFSVATQSGLGAQRMTLWPLKNPSVFLPVVNSPETTCEKYSSCARSRSECNWVSIPQSHHSCGSWIAK